MYDPQARWIETRPLTPGMEMSNGALVLATGNRATMPDQGADVVLATWQRGHERREWITWRVDPEGNAYGGMYFDTLWEAALNLQGRCTGHANTREHVAEWLDKGSVW